MPVRLGEWADVDIVESDAYDLEAIWVDSEAQSSLPSPNVHLKSPQNQKPIET
jgi:hypothetical protein